MAVRDVQVFRLDVQSQFDGLDLREKRYAHHMARAAWAGARVILRQVSPESIHIFDFILELYRSCSGNWDDLINDDVCAEAIDGLLIYCAVFLSNIGNYFGSGDQKFIPNVSAKVWEHVSQRSPELQVLYSRFSSSLYAIPPFSLGYPSEKTQSSYYLGKGDMTEDEISTITTLLQTRGIFPENTRVHKIENGIDFNVLIASSEIGELEAMPHPSGSGTIRLVKGDHAAELEKMCRELSEASKYTANDLQKTVLQDYIASLQSGSLHKYRDSQRSWVRDKAPKVEHIFGFIEPYRDPHGVRAEFEALVAISDRKESALLAKLVENSATFIKRLPWAALDNDGKGVFEKNLFEPPDLASIHTLAYCSSIIFPGINLPNYNDIRQDVGFKNVIISNRMITESQAKGYPFIDEAELETFRSHKFPVYYWWVVLHELLGHGTGRMMMEESEGQYNFDMHNPPMNPLTGSPITSWYKTGQTWTGQFEDLATTVDECRAELVGAYLMDDTELLNLFGFTHTSAITSDDVTYNMYQQLGVDGLRGLANFNNDTKKWGQAHSRAHFAILRCLLLDSDGCVTIEHDKEAGKLTVRVDRGKIISHGKPALGRMLLRLHIYRCTADVAACREYYEMLSEVSEEHLEWRKLVLANKPPPLVFVHANTFADGETVTLKEYEPSVKGIVQSWAERTV